MPNEIIEVDESEYEESYNIDTTKLAITEPHSINMYSRLTAHNDNLFQATQLLYLLDRLKRKRFDKINKDKVTYLNEICQLQINGILDDILNQTHVSKELYVYDNPSQDMLFVFMKRFDVYIKECSRPNKWFNLRKLKWRSTSTGYDILYPTNIAALSYIASNQSYTLQEDNIFPRLETVFARKRITKSPLYITCKIHDTPIMAITKRH